MPSSRSIENESAVITNHQGVEAEIEQLTKRKVHAIGIAAKARIKFTSRLTRKGIRAIAVCK